MPFFPGESRDEAAEKDGSLPLAPVGGLSPKGPGGTVFPGDILMNDQDTSKKEKISELERLRQRVSELEAYKQEMNDTENELRQSRKLLQLVLDSIPVRIFWKDTQLNYLGCNRQFARDAGLHSPLDIIGSNDFHHPWKEQAELYRADDTRVICSGTPKINY